jgi:hypothetical protein
MNLKQWRETYPDWDNCPDEQVLAEFEIEVGEEPDLVVPALYDIEEAVEKLCAAVCEIKIPDHTAPVLDLLKQIKNALGSLEVAIKKIDVNVTTAAPVVNIPKADPIVFPKMAFPEPLTEWDFEVITDRNGWPVSVKARAK